MWAPHVSFQAPAGPAAHSAQERWDFLTRTHLPGLPSESLPQEMGSLPAKSP